MAKNSAGLRVRAHPSLQSEQIGVVCVNGTIAFIDEVNCLKGVHDSKNHCVIYMRIPLSRKEKSGKGIPICM